MSKLPILDTDGRTAREIDLPEGLFSYPVKTHLIYEAVVNYRANQRRGTAATKTRAMVSGGGRKPWRQKGTGRARAGSNRSPLWRKGGTTFGPQPRDYSYAMPKKARRNALLSALTQKFEEQNLMIVETLEFKEPKTRDAVRLLKALNLSSALLVDNQDNTNLFLAVRNVPGVKAVDPGRINIYDVLNHTGLVFSQRAFEFLREKWS
ncbi:MAG: 50S ribosomal protein L4 [Acidobacteriota bacterium]|nr:50S ribosomal protein L4 [Acidobacteriota bacterium]